MHHKLFPLLTSGFFGRPRPRPDLGLGAGCTHDRLEQTRKKKQNKRKRLCAPKPFRWRPCAGGRVRASRRGRRRGWPPWRAWLPWRAAPPWPLLPVEKEEEATRNRAANGRTCFFGRPRLRFSPSFWLMSPVVRTCRETKKKKKWRHSGRAEQTAPAAHTRPSQPPARSNAPLH
jgi:hypothetical protein